MLTLGFVCILPVSFQYFSGNIASCKSVFLWHKDKAFSLLALLTKLVFSLECVKHWLCLCMQPAVLHAQFVESVLTCSRDIISSVGRQNSLT